MIGDRETTGIERLRSARTSAKWRAYDADVLPAWIAEMDLDLAPCVAQRCMVRSTGGTPAIAGMVTFPRSWSSSVIVTPGWSFLVEHVVVVQDVLTGMAESMRRAHR
jgi:Bifunctional PLP-dependent enzyme with beta-cystathionase and maltose regulon repressor activities